MQVLSKSTHQGFTLIEILVVVVVVAIAMSVVVNAFTGSDRQQEYTGYMHRLALVTEMARDKAMQRNREWGMHVEDHSIYFSEFDPINGIWVPQRQKPFKQNAFSQELEFSVEVEAFAGIELSADLFRVEDNDADDEEEGADPLAELDFSATNASESDDEDFPDVVIFSSGEVTPFVLTTTPEWTAEPLLLHSDGFSKTLVRGRDEEIEPDRVLTGGFN